MGVSFAAGRGSAEATSRMGCGAAAAVGAAESVAPMHAAKPLPKVGDDARDDGLLLFRAGGETPKALRLASLLRIEEITLEQIEQMDGKPVMLYRGAPLPLHLCGAILAGERRFVLIATHEGRMCGFIADAVIDTVEETPALDRARARPGVLGVATVAGRPLEIIDAAHYVKAASTRLPSSTRSAA